MTERDALLELENCVERAGLDWSKLVQLPPMASVQCASKKWDKLVVKT